MGIRDWFKPRDQLFLQLLVRPAPLLGGIGGQLAAVDGKSLLADQTELSLEQVLSVQRTR